MNFWKNLFLFAYRFALSVFLIATPWSHLWNISVFASMRNLGSRIYLSYSFRLLVSTLGILTLVVAFNGIIEYFKNERNNMN
ncbi:MAG: hypothetical protein JW737_06285 [Acidobacteria bacterium]|nr:hypothetical protein [Acidobacteriota bacterium]